MTRQPAFQSLLTERRGRVISIERAWSCETYRKHNNFYLRVQASERSYWARLVAPRSPTHTSPVAGPRPTRPLSCVSQANGYSSIFAVMARIPQDPFSPLSSSASIPPGGSLLDAPINPTRPVLQPHVPSPSSDMTSSLPPSATTTLSPTHGSATKHRSLSQLGRVSGATGRDGDGNGGAGGGDVRQLKLRLQYLEGILSRMQKEKAGMDEEFGRQRKKFMQQMVDLECEPQQMLCYVYIPYSLSPPSSLSPPLLSHNINVHLS